MALAGPVKVSQQSSIAASRIEQTEGEKQGHKRIGRAHVERNQVEVEQLGYRRTVFFNHHHIQGMHIQIKEICRVGQLDDALQVRPQFDHGLSASFLPEKVVEISNQEFLNDCGVFVRDEAIDRLYDIASQTRSLEERSISLELILCKVPAQLPGMPG